MVFEYLTAAGTAVAEHADPTDQNQTFSVADDSTSGSTTTSTTTTTTTIASTTTTIAETTGTATGGPVQSLPRTGTGPQDMIRFAGVAILGGLILLGLRRLGFRIR